MELWPVEGPWPGQLAVCSRPRAGWFLDDDVRALKLAGYSTLISALTPEEVVVAELQRVPQICEAAGLGFVHFPVGNLQVAPFERAHPELLGWANRLRAGEGLAMHCWASVGRGPTLAAGLLVLSGIEPADAWERIRLARGRDVPDTGEQRLWPGRLAASHEVDQPS